MDELPPHSRTHTALRVKYRHLPDDQKVFDVDEDVEPGDAPWTHEAMLIAQNTDAINRLAYLLARINGVNDFPEPQPVPRPGVLLADQKPKKQAPHPLLMEWLRRRQAGEDTSELGFDFENVTPLRRPQTE